MRPTATQSTHRTKEPIVLNPILLARASVFRLAAVAAASAIAGVALTACDAAAQHRPAHPQGLAALPAAPAAAPARPTTAPVPTGSAALYRYRDDVDPSHAAVASYAD